jgi:F-type H+-transporting ATPase subunit epsilon
MDLKIFLPYDYRIFSEVRKINAEGEEGAFCILPRHIGYTTVLRPGILSFTGQDGEERHIACGDGVLVKQGETVFVSTSRALFDAALGTMEKTIEEQYRRELDEEKKINTIVNSVEIDLARRIFELSEDYEAR